MSRPLKIRPYARLLTMLGEQLIKNERIALVELIKNSYDADASWVKISFEKFGPNFEVTMASKIIIEDDGSGMSLDVLENHWLSPATPVKKLGKLLKNTTAKGRIIQGEKGIGRFAILKLGKKIIITTRPNRSRDEFEVDLDFTHYDDDFLEEHGKQKKLFLEDLSIKLTERPASTIVKKTVTLGTTTLTRAQHGTTIEISHLKGTWSQAKIELVFKDLVRLESIFTYGLVREKSKTPQELEKEFEVFIYKDNTEQQYTDKYLDDLRNIIEDNAVIKIEHARYDEPAREFQFEINGHKQALSLHSPEITGNALFKRTFKKIEYDFTKRTTTCGSFNFGFYVFDLNKDAPPTFLLKSNDKNIIKEHRIYLYRDGIRVYPYGDPEDDWLHIDQYRGTISAGQFLSNDQVVGFINISQTENPDLKDKTNREGLIDTGDATEHFIWLLQIFLSWLRAGPYARYRLSLADKNAVTVYKQELVKSGFAELRDAVKDNPAAREILAKAEKQYDTERKYLVQRVETTEDLAGVGLSVETASHDIMSVMHKAQIAVDSLIRATYKNRAIDPVVLQNELIGIKGMLSFMEAQMKDVQLLFKSSKQRRKNVRVIDTLNKVVRLFDSILEIEGVTLEIKEVGSPLVAKTTDAVLLQVFLNLFDNAVYWLQTGADSDRRIEIVLDGQDGIMIFGDNGPGIRQEDAMFIFEPFYSGKGEDGRGLGLYIARQLLERQEYQIELADLKAHKILRGANFVLTFVKD